MRVSLLALLLGATTVLAGCLSGSTPAPTATGGPDTPIPPTPAGTFVSGGNLTRLDPVAAEILSVAQGAARYTGIRAFEPTLGITPSGGVFMSNSAGRAARSLDNGSSWDAVTPTVRSPLDNDPYLYVDPGTGRLFTNANHGAACTVLYFSDDLGETWQTNPAACPVPPNDHQTMVTAKPRGTPTVGYPNIVYMCVNALVATNCARSLDGGLTFHALPPAYVWPRDGCDASLGHMAASPDGVLYIPKGDCEGPLVLVSKDDGMTWALQRIPAPQGVYGHEVRVAVDEAGNVYAFWQGDDGLPYLAASRDEGATWTPPRMVGFDGLTGMDFPAIAAGAEGRIAFAYVGTDYPKPYEVDAPEALTPQLENPVNIEGMNWYAYIGVITEALDENATILTVTAGDPGDPISRGQCGRVRCAGVGDFIAIQIGPDGRPWAAFADACTEDCASAGGTENNYGALGGGSAPGFVGTLVRGPALRGEVGPLPVLPEPQAAPVSATGNDSALDALRRRLGL